MLKLIELIHSEKENVVRFIYIYYEFCIRNGIL